MAAAAVLSGVAPDRTREFVPVEVYLQTAYHPDCEYVDGQVLERFVGEKPHSRLQHFLQRFFSSIEMEWKVELLPEQRVQISEQRYRVPDLCLVPFQNDGNLIVQTAPMLCIEILSREDRAVQILEKVQDYRIMGVPAIWIVNPWTKQAFNIEPNGDWTRVLDDLRLTTPPVRLSVEVLFRALTEQQPLPEATDPGHSL